MPKNTRKFIVLAAPAIVGGGLLATLAGCSSSGDSKAAGSLSAADFRAANADQTADAAKNPRPAPAYRTEPVDPAANGQGFTVLQGAPTLDPAPPAIPGVPDAAPVMMDALVGDINGTPIYATAFFAPLEARLIELAGKTRTNQQTWNVEARMVIGGLIFDQKIQRPRIFGRLGDLIRDQLLLAEARSSLTPEQKQGLLSFIDQVRRDLVSKGGGGQAAVDETLKEQGEKGLEAKLKENIDRQLIYANLREKILPRVSVSWHEVQIEYDRRAEKFNPDPTAVFRLIWITTKKTELVEEFKSELARGVAFKELALRPENEYKAKDGGLEQRTFKGDYANAPLFGPKELNTAARALKPGGISDPIVFNDYTAWILLERIDTPHAKSIYEAQLEIYNELREKKLNAEMDKYLLGLLDQQSFSKLSEMGDKLFQIATERYYTKAP